MPRKSQQKQVVIRDEAFAKRLEQSCDGFGVPPLHSGRYTWIVAQFKNQYGVSITTETVRKWYAGEVRPRRRAMSLLSQLLMVDEAWLSLGSKTESTPAEKKARDAMADGGVNLIAGWIRFDGASVAFPDPNDKASRDVDIFAIIKGAQYKFKVVTGVLDEKGATARFAIPNSYRDLFVLGVVRTGTFALDVLELDTATIDQHRSTKGGHSELVLERHGQTWTAGKTRIKKLTGFQERP